MDTAMAQPRQSFIKRAITFGELIGFSITLAVILVTAWVQINVRLSLVEQDQRAKAEQFKEVKEMLKDIQKTQTEILVNLNNKVDRKRE